MVRRANAIEARKEMNRKARAPEEQRCVKCRRSFSEEKAKKSGLEMYRSYPRETRVLGEEYGKFWEVMCATCVRDHCQSFNRTAVCKCDDCGRLFDTTANMEHWADAAKDIFKVSDVIQPLSNRFDRPWEHICTHCFQGYVERAFELVEGMTLDMPLNDN